MKKISALAALFALVAFARIAAGVAAIPFADDMEGRTSGQPLAGQGDWGSLLDDWPGDPPVVVNGLVSSGGPAGSLALRGSHNGSLGGAGIRFTPTSGVVDLHVHIGGNTAHKRVFLEGDGKEGQDSNYYVAVFVQGVQFVSESYLKGNGHSNTYVTGPMPPNNWFELHAHMDFNANTMLVEWRDIDDVTGVPIDPGLYTTIYSGTPPFTAFSYFGAGQLWNATKGFMDNLRVTHATPAPEPATLSLLALSGALALLRRRTA